MVSVLLAMTLSWTHAQQSVDLNVLKDRGLADLGAHRMLADLTTSIGGRLSGSPEAARAVLWAKKQMETIRLENIKLVPCMVPHWVRGKEETAMMNPGGKLQICALGGSVGTRKSGIEAEVIAVSSLEEAAQLGKRGQGKIVFINRGFDTKFTSTFEAYGDAVGVRYSAASAAAKSGAVAVLIRSMTFAKDDAPHTGAMGYEPGPKIPAAALGIQSADRLLAELKKGKVSVKLEMNCQSLPDEPSANVIGEIVGQEKPDEIIVMGGHLDSWDLGKGAHDDGAGVTQALEALRLLKLSGFKLKRTVRVCAWMNEENGGRGAEAYAAMAKSSRQKHVAAVESDSGGFMPRAFGVSKERLAHVQPWLKYLSPFGIERFNEGGGDADISPLEPLGTALFALEPDNQRYFDYHHSRNDTIDKVNPRELEMGAIAMATLAWLISEESL